MKYKTLANLTLVLSTLWLAAAPQHAVAEDIDVFVGATGGAADPNVLIILDNSSNWSASNQNWPTDSSPPVDCGNDCDKQGYYELRAIRTVVNALPVDANGDASINLGIMLFNNSNATRDGGYVRFHVRPMTAANKVLFLAEIDSIISNFNTETAATSVQYGAILFDAFKYFGGLTNPDNAATNATPATNPTYESVHVFGTEFWGSNTADGSKPDPAAYNGADYVPPTQTACGRNHIVFIGNGFPAKGNTVPDMEQVLRYLTDPDSPPASISEFAVTTYTPVLGSCTAVETEPGSICNSAEDCQSALDSYSDSTHPDLGNIYQCVEEKKVCGNKQYKVHACTITAWNVDTAVPSANAAFRYGDEYTDFLYRTDVSSVEEQQNITTHTINVFKDQPSADQEALMRSMAKRGGGKYYNAKTAGAIEAALQEIMAEILSVNSTFASASLPVNATNRAYNENQVFIGMFRPDPDAKPRWFGNLKRYQLALFDNAVGLADIDGLQAVNTQTGFVTECAASWWSTDSGSWWSDYPITPAPSSGCTTSPNDPFSDSPDGPSVEKGAVAEVIRKGNNPPDTNTAPTWSINRTMLTQSGTSLVEFNDTNSGLSDDLVDFIKGHDVNDEDGDGNTDEPRASLHGGVIHSRPLPVNYDNAHFTGIVVYYGANDGAMHAVDASTGKELWAFVPTELYSDLLRLKDNSPIVNYPGLPPTAAATAQPMSYYFDGSMGIYQNADDSSVWIFPTLRRGGRAIYGIDVTNPNSPSLKWKLDPTNLSNLGQTWSRPNVARIAGFSATSPVIVVGGGYDACEDSDSASPACGSTTGNAVYVINADTGAVIRTFNTTRSVVADVSLVDVDFDGKVDYAYAADMGGNIWRINFVNPADHAPLSSASWTMTKVAYTDGDGRKFLYGPALLPTRLGNTDYIYLAIGSGDREHPLLTHYPYQSNVLNRLYVYLDNTSNNSALDLDDTASDTGTMNLTNNTDCDSPDGVLLPGTDKQGWFMDLSQFGQGEQTVTSALIVGGMVTFSTNRPIAAASCGTVLGEARGYWVNLLTASGAIGVSGNCGGSRAGAFVSGGLPPSPVFATVPITDHLGNLKIVNVIIGAIQKRSGGGGGDDGGGGGGSSPGTDSPIEGQEIEPTIEYKRHRIYWYTEAED